MLYLNINLLESRISHSLDVSRTFNLVAKENIGSRSIIQMKSILREQWIYRPAMVAKDNAGKERCLEQGFDLEEISVHVYQKGEGIFIHSFSHSCCCWVHQAAIPSNCWYVLVPVHRQWPSVPPRLSPWRDPRRLFAGPGTSPDYPQ